MKFMLIAALALACVLGLASANYGYGGYGGVGQSGGSGGFLMLIGLLFILIFIFQGSANKQTTTLAIINGTG